MLRKITADEFFSMVTQLNPENKVNVGVEVVTPETFTRNGFLPELDGVDMSLLGEDIKKWMGKALVFEKIKFNKCTLIGVKFNECFLDECKLLNQVGLDADCLNAYCALNNCIALLAGELEKTAFMKRINYSYHSQIVNKAERSLLAVVYTPSHGTYYTDDAIAIFEAKGINVVKIDSDSMRKKASSRYYNYENKLDTFHPFLAALPYADGMLLPGGQNVETIKDEYGCREELETAFMNTSLAKKIPLFAVCRGHQFVGHFFGAEVRDVDHMSDQIYVTGDQKTRLRDLLETKYGKHLQKKKSGGIFKVGDVLSYKSRCAHRQGIFFEKPADPSKADVKVAAQSLDGLIESLQVNDHILTFQHHHEGCQQTSVGKAVLKRFAEMILEYHENKNKPPQIEDGNVSEGKRAAEKREEDPTENKKMKP
jgi:gamma-glutamyl-gamma-aminobutyrate hydrolase PuuD